MMGVFAVPFRGKKAVLVPVSVLSFKRPTAGAFAVAFLVLNQKKNMTDDVLF